MYLHVFMASWERIHSCIFLNKYCFNCIVFLGTTASIIRGKTFWTIIWLVTVHYIIDTFVVLVFTREDFHYVDNSQWFNFSLNSRVTVLHWQKFSASTFPTDSNQPPARNPRAGHTAHPDRARAVEPRPRTTGASFRSAPSFPFAPGVQRAGCLVARFFTGSSSWKRPRYGKFHPFVLDQLGADLIFRVQPDFSITIRLVCVYVRCTERVRCRRRRDHVYWLLGASIFSANSDSRAAGDCQGWFLTSKGLGFPSAEVG